MDIKNLPFISVIIPVYNGEKTIQKCVESLLNQNYPKDKYEIIVVDNNSKDKTAKIVKRYAVRYVEEKRIQNSYVSRNMGVRYSKGEIIAFIDADCIPSQDWLKEGVGTFTKDEIGCVAGTIKGYKPTNFVEEYLCKRNIILQEGNPKDLPLPYAKTANAFYRKEIFDRIGPFEERWISAGDADFSWRMQLETDYKIKFASDAVVFHRHRSTIFSMFTQCVKWGRGFTYLYKKYKNRMQRRTFKQTLWVLWRLLYTLAKTVIFCFCNKEKMVEEKKREYLDLITFMGWEIGRIIGSIRNRVFYI